ncbi:hypothetical protein Nepgr_002542 [Nepenthes gracilis]|uniref:Cytochrome c-553 n=1 Tax=Nepenthes gracilis TaxID=150966 RepID=A0AAD3P755_NEPGR|nr:hypothetical protein Nepgr_002542 [Nepenthes gracilis]
MPQTTLLVSGVSTPTVDSKRRPFLEFQAQKINPLSNSHLLFSPFAPISTPSSSASGFRRTLPLLKSPLKKVSGPKSRTEEDIFGPSGGIGFTRQNELFAGRVDMLGFAGKLKEEDGKYPDAKDPKAVQILKLLVSPPVFVAALLVLSPLCYAPASLAEAVDIQKGAALFRRSCIGCHDGGGNIIQPGSTLFANDLKRNGVETEEQIYGITYYGKGRMPGFGEKCLPKGQCTFGPRLDEEEIKILARLVRSKADQGWPTID